MGLPAVLPAVIPVAIKALKEVLGKKRPDIVKEIESIFEDPQTRIELEKLALERLKLEQQVERWELEDRASARELARADALGDNWLSKNVRPLTLIVVTGIFLALTLTSAFTEIKTPQGIVETYQSLLMWVYAFYFGGRSVEKCIAVMRSK